MSHVSSSVVTPDTTRKLLFSFRPFLMLILFVSIHLASTNYDANAFFQLIIYMEFSFS